MTQRSLTSWAFLVGALCLGAPAAHAQSVRVVVPTLDIRSEPNPIAKVLAQAQRGDFLEVAEEASAEWLMVRLPGSDRLGFVSSAGIERIADRVPASDPPPRAEPSDSASWPKERVTLLLSGGLAPQTLSTSEATTFRLYQEDGGRLTSSYEYGLGSHFDVTLRYLPLAGRLGLQASFTTGGRKATTHVDAMLPHPLYFDRARTVTSEPTGYLYSEQALHADLVVAAGHGRLRAAVFGGVTYFDVEADLLERLQFTQQYPYTVENVSVVSARPVALTDNPRGYNVGGTLDVVLHRHVGLGAELRYSAGTARLVHPAGSGDVQDVTGTQSVWPGTTPVELKVGGLALAAGLRLYF